MVMALHGHDPVTPTVMTMKTWPWHHVVSHTADTADTAVAHFALAFVYIRSYSGNSPTSGRQ